MTAPAADTQGRTPMVDAFSSIADGKDWAAATVAGQFTVLLHHGKPIGEIHPETAAFIVRCCNSHDALVEALTVALLTLVSVGPGDSDNMTIYGTDGRRITDPVATIRAALRAARGEGEPHG